MLENIDSLNIDINTSKAQGIILTTLNNAHQQGSREVDLGVLKENAKTELPYFADAISILREEFLIYSPSYGVFGITTLGREEYDLRKSYGALH
ncbi:MAG: hypothetical protein AB7V56_08830 [Candidatus Nitrosocosmicus sp.]